MQRSQDKLQSDLWMRINENMKIFSLLGEPPSVTERRKQLTSLIQTLDKSMKVLQRDPDITAAGIDDDELSQELKRAQLEEKQNPQQRQGPPQQQNMRPDPNRMNP